MKVCISQILVKNISNMICLLIGWYNHCSVKAYITGDSTAIPEKS